MGKRIYSLEFRREAVRRTGEPGVTLSQVAREVSFAAALLRAMRRTDIDACGAICAHGARCVGEIERRD